MPRTMKRFRQQRGWSQAELARRAGVHSTTISLIESGRLAAYDSQIEKIAKAFDIPIERATKLVHESEESK